MKHSKSIILFFFLSLPILGIAQVMPVSFFQSKVAAVIGDGAIVTSGLIVHLDAGNTASYPSTGGTTWNDISGNNNNGTLVNGVGYNAANGGSLVFDGVNDFVRVGPIPSTGTSTASVSWGLWVYPTSISGNIMSMSSSNPAGGWNMPPIAATDQKFRGKIWPNNYLNSAANYSLNTWYYLVLVFDYTATTQRFYVNGILQSSQANISYGASGSDNFMFLGQSNPGADNTGMFTGRIAIFQIYGNKALTDAEITQNFNATKARFGL
jgi:hypothetical protein